jgi:hypothetical protein
MFAMLLSTSSARATTRFKTAPITRLLDRRVTVSFWDLSYFEPARKTNGKQRVEITLME